MNDASCLAELRFTATVIEWRGPPPYLFAPVPPAHVPELHWAAREASYGWAVVPVEVTIGQTIFRTSLFPRGGGYLVPLKASARNAADIALGDVIQLRLRVYARAAP